MKTKNRILKWVRIVHRDLGFLMVGVSIIYAVSGIIVNHMGETDPAYDTVAETITIQSGVSDQELPELFANEGLPTIKSVAKIDSTHSRVMLEGGVGVYSSQSGELTYEQHRQRKIVYWFNRLHLNRVSGWSIMGDFFAISLIFFAISGVFMVKGKNSVLRRGKWYLLAGLLIPIAYVLFS